MMDKLMQFTKNKNNLILLVLAGVLLMVITFPVKDKDSMNDKADNSENNNRYQMNPESTGIEDGTEYLSNEQLYISQMEEKLTTVLSKLDGAGSVEVLITLEASEEKIVEKDAPVVRSETEETDASGGTRLIQNVDMGESTVYTNGDNGSDPYVVKTISPRIEGVVVLAEGAGNGTVSLNISEAVQVLFDIEAHKIKVMKMDGTK